MLSRTTLLVTVLALSAMTVQVNAFANSSDDRRSKLFPVVQIVTFNNDPCRTTAGQNGVCYSQKECTNLNGIASGTCANGFGVCCRFVVSVVNGVIPKIAVNGTQWVNTGNAQQGRQLGGFGSNSVQSAVILPPPGTCQLLLTFDTFDILGPIEGNCDNDTFVFMGSNRGSNIPVICGQNTGQHMYIDIDNSAGPYSMMVSTSSAPYARSFAISVYFIEKTNPCRPPSRCLQYFMNPSGPFSSFNFGGANPIMLNNQEYAICFRYNPGMCDIGLSFSRFDLGPVIGPCTGNYLSVGGSNICGDYRPYNTVSNSTGPQIIYVFSDGSNALLMEGFAGNYLMMPCV